MRRRGLPAALAFAPAAPVRPAAQRGYTSWEAQQRPGSQTALAPRRRTRTRTRACAVPGDGAAARRRYIGVPKNVAVGPGPRALTAEESPWEDYLQPTLRGDGPAPCAATFARGAARPFVVLGVESSCDDTAAAVVRSDGTVLGEASVSQRALTAEWGGVVPHVARDAHERAIDSVIGDALDRAGVTAAQLDAVAATMGPGLEVCLRVGYRAARAVAREHALPFAGVNHLEAHILVARLAEQRGGAVEATGADSVTGTETSTGEGTDTDTDTTGTSMETTADTVAAAAVGVEFPFLTLLVSGGHCQLLLARGVADYEVLGGTLDDALGEAYDKTARLLGLDVGAGGGPALEALARGGDAHAIPFPVPMWKRGDCNFSFAGLKTSVRTAIARLGGLDTVRGDAQQMADVAASFQHTAVTHVEQRVRRAMQWCARDGLAVDTLVVSGGVASNRVVRARLGALCEAHGWRCAVPPARLCTDNGVMVAWAGVERLWCGMTHTTERVDVRARWPLAGLGDMVRYSTVASSKQRIGAQAKARAKAQAKAQAKAEADAGCV